MTPKIAESDRTWATACRGGALRLEMRIVCSIVRKFHSRIVEMDRSNRDASESARLLLSVLNQESAKKRWICRLHRSMSSCHVQTHKNAAFYVV